MGQWHALGTGESTYARESAAPSTLTRAQTRGSPVSCCQHTQHVIIPILRSNMRLMADTAEPAPTHTRRPYRSHAWPACDRCKKRKIRCDLDVAGQPCRYCRTCRETCHYTQKSISRRLRSTTASLASHVTEYVLTQNTRKRTRVPLIYLRSRTT